MSYDARDWFRVAKEIDAVKNNEYKHMLNAIYGGGGREMEDWMTEMRAGDFDGDMGMNSWIKGVIHDILSCYRISNVGQPECAITKVIFNDPATIVFWSDGTKTVVKCGEADIYDKEKGLAMAISKKAMGNQGNYYKVFKKWIPELKVDDNASTSEAVILAYNDIMKAVQSYGEQLAKGFKNTFDILGIKPSKDGEKND